MYIHIYIYIYIHTLYTYIYTHLSPISIYIYIYMYIMCIYIYIHTRYVILLRCYTVTLYDHYMSVSVFVFLLVFCCGAALFMYSCTRHIIYCLYALYTTTLPEIVSPNRPCAVCCCVAVLRSLAALIVILAGPW